MPSHWDRKGRN